MKKILLGIVAAIVVFVLGANGAKYVSDISLAYSAFKESMSGLHGVKLGDSQEELLYAMGEPDYVQRDINSPERSVTAGFQDGTKISDYRIWKWTRTAPILSAEFDPTSKSVVIIGCYENPFKPGCRTVGGITSFSSGAYEDYIVGRLGAPDRTDYAPVSGTAVKYLHYDTLGLQLAMKERRLVAVWKSKAEPDFFWWFKHSRSW